MGKTESPIFLAVRSSRVVFLRSFGAGFPSNTSTHGCAVGCILSPLRGWRRSHFSHGILNKIAELKVRAPGLSG